MQFDTNDEVTAAVDALMTLAGQYDRGQCIDWPTIELIAGDRREPGPRYIINKWRRKLETDRALLTLPAVNIGIRILTDEEAAAEIPALRQRRAYRQIRRALRQTALIETSRLSDHQRRLLTLQRANMAAQRRELFRSQRQLATGAPPETAPRRPPSPPPPA